MPAPARAETTVAALAGSEAPTWMRGGARSLGKGALYGVAATCALVGSLALGLHLYLRPAARPTPVASAAKNCYAMAVATGGGGAEDYVPHLTDHVARASGVDPVKS